MVNKFGVYLDCVSNFNGQQVLDDLAAKRITFLNITREQLAFAYMARLPIWDEVAWRIINTIQHEDGSGVSFILMFDDDDDDDDKTAYLRIDNIFGNTFQR